MKGQALYAHAKQRIPGGTQLLSKRPEMFLPDHWPAYYARASGVEVEDLDGRRYVDMSIMGVGACVLGYADAEVDAAVRCAIEAGTMCTLNAPEEVALADVLCELHPWAQMVRYARAGGEAMAVAVRIARAHTRRDVVAFSGYHGWTDWYLAANLAEGSALDGQLMPGLEPRGVPRGLLGSALPFHYNRIDELKRIVSAEGGRLAAIVMEPRRDQAPEPGFLEAVRDIASSVGAVLIFDEITTGFRMTAGGIHRLLGVTPDLAVLAKAMANGYAMAAVIGTEPVMQAAQSTFISSTNWTERLGPAAALATIAKYRRDDVAPHLIDIGRRVIAGWEEAGRRAGLAVHAGGLPTLAHFEFAGDDDATLSTLFAQLMLDRGYLAFTQFKPSFAHRAEHVTGYVAAVNEAFAEIAEAVRHGRAAKLLRGPRARRGFYRLT